MWKIFLVVVNWLMAGVMWFLSIFGIGGDPFAYKKEVAQVVQSVVDAINAEDAEALQAMMCPKVHEWEEDLPGKIETLFELIDGEITNYVMQDGGRYLGGRNGGHQQSIGILFTVNSTGYVLGFNWDFAEEESPPEVGIHDMSLGKTDTIWCIHSVHWNGLESFCYACNSRII